MAGRPQLDRMAARDSWVGGSSGVGPTWLVTALETRVRRGTGCSPHRGLWRVNEMLWRSTSWKVVGRGARDELLELMIADMTTISPRLPRVARILTVKCMRRLIIEQ